MVKRIKVACIIGTRPEVIKMAPVIRQLQEHPQYEVSIINTAQHRELVDDMLEIFHIVPDFDMGIMQKNQSLATLTGQLFLKLEPIILQQQFDLILAQGDTTTTFVAAQVAFYHKIPFGHIEAGLRSWDFYNPFPEELNRVFISKLATWHFPPTEVEKEILLAEKIDAQKILVTGNTGIDSLFYIAEHPVPLPMQITGRIILVTLHRRESFGAPLEEIFSALLQLVQTVPDVEIIYPVHPNPQVNAIAHQLLGKTSRIHLINPMRYDQFVSLMKQAYLIMTDSGGIQEEAPALAKPLLILRNVTERPLIIKLGLGKLVGTNKEAILNTALELLNNPDAYKAMQKNISPYGDGKAAERIVQMINDYYETEVCS